MQNDFGNTLKLDFDAIIKVLIGNSNDKTAVRAAALSMGLKSAEIGKADYSACTQSIFAALNPAFKPEFNVQKQEKPLDEWNSESERIADIGGMSNALIDLARECFEGVPVIQKGSPLRDMSLYQVIRQGAALLKCLHLGQADKPFVLYSLDLSGIQNFIYTVSTKGALKALRARSLYISLLLEVTVDDILDQCGLSRANLIYCGGGRAYMILPNVPELLAIAEKTIKSANAFLMDTCDTSLYLTSGYTEFGDEDLLINGSKTRLGNLFRSLSAKTSAAKLCRYTAEDIKKLNERETDGQRECAVCGMSRTLQQRSDEGDYICAFCAALERFASGLKNDMYGFEVTNEKASNSISLPQGRFITPLQARPNQAQRVYCVKDGERQPFTQRYYVSLYGLPGNERALTFDESIDASSGVKRLGVYRADVDNLGALFAGGFEKSGTPYNLVRYAALSDALTKFFQKDIDGILASAKPLFNLNNIDRVSVVYAGGDDVFITGPWDGTLACGLALRNAFIEYTGGSVTLSAGFGLYHRGLPVGVMAQKTAELEALAKELPHKNSIALFGINYVNGHENHYVIDWNELNGSVINEKLRTLNELFGSPANDDKASRFLYRLNTLFALKYEGDLSALPRIAYHLARNSPEMGHLYGAEAPEKHEAVPTKDIFSKSCYKWAFDQTENLDFRIAVLLYVYANRTSGILSQE